MTSTNTDTARCIADGAHHMTQRHALVECPGVDASLCIECNARPAGDGHFGAYCTPCAEMPFGTAAAL